MAQKIKNKLKYWYHKYYLGQEQCPDCGTWCNAYGPVWFTGLDEYKCEKCNKYFQA